MAQLYSQWHFNNFSARTAVMNPCLLITLNADEAAVGVSARFVGQCGTLKEMMEDAPQPKKSPTAGSDTEPAPCRLDMTALVQGRSWLSATTFQALMAYDEAQRDESVVRTRHFHSRHKAQGWASLRKTNKNWLHYMQRMEESNALSAFFRGQRDAGARYPLARLYNLMLLADFLGYDGAVRDAQFNVCVAIQEAVRQCPWPARNPDLAARLQELLPV